MNLPQVHEFISDLSVLLLHRSIILFVCQYRAVFDDYSCVIQSEVQEA